MDQIAALIFSWQFLTLGLMTWFIMNMGLKIGKALWKIKRLRGLIRIFSALVPWIPWLIGGALGAIPVWPRPQMVAEIDPSYQYVTMIILGILSGAMYERIWKGVKQVIEARGIDLDSDMSPHEQKKAKKE